MLNNVPFMHMSLAEQEVLFVNRYHDTWPSGIAALSGKLLDLKPLVTHVYPLKEAVEAMNLCGDLSKGSIKVQIVDDDDIAPLRR